MRVPVTGAGGYTEQKLVMRLIVEGHQVRVLVRRHNTTGMDHLGFSPACIGSQRYQGVASGRMYE
jgi:nucleoside-diphosphate-sugar epimerase